MVEYLTIEDPLVAEFAQENGLSMEVAHRDLNEYYDFHYGNQREE